MSTDENSTPGTLDLLDEQERSKILSTTRLKVILSAFVVALLLGLGALAFVQVSRIFEQLTPAVAKDLAWKSERGTAELSYTTELALALGEAEAVKEAAETYLNDQDLRSLVVLDSEDKVLFSHPAGMTSEGLFSGPEGKVKESKVSFSTWKKVDIEGAEIGKVALEISKKRLEAGDQLRKDILTGVGGGSLLAFLVSLSFVSFYIAPLVRVTERAFIDLKQRTNEALESARLKSEFLANMSHEIRTPMNGVIGMGELLQKTSLTKKQRRYVRTISTSASALLTIINDILDFSKIDAKKLVVRPVETEVRRLAEEVSQLLAPLGQSKGIEVMVSIGAELPREVMLDRDRLRQVLNNVMGNAVKFTNKGSVLLRVWLEEHIRGEDACVLAFSVTDTGIGIAPDDLGRIFEHFSQADGSLTRTAGGTGLGLSISRHLVELMGGQLVVESELGKGSCFSFKLRCDVVTGEGSRPSGKLPRTLIVDDNETNRTLFEEIFESWGVPNDSARSAHEALDMLKAACDEGKDFELALVDHLMDGMDGPALARAIRHSTLGRIPRLILVTSLSESDHLDEAFDDGLTKPVLQDDLRRIVQGTESTGAVESAEDITRLQFVGRPKVLVAEDNAINREVMREILSELEVDADLVENGEEAVEAIEAGNYPLVLMDCQMPIMDGYEATRIVRKLDGEKSKVPIVAVTAHAVQGERDKAIAAGMTDYLTKPVTITRLVRMMAKFLETQAVPRSDRAFNQNEARVTEEKIVVSEPNILEGDTAHNNDGSPTVQSASLPPVQQSTPTPHEKELALDPGVRRSKAVIGLFRKMVPEQVSGLKEAANSRDTEETRQGAHKLKGSCLALGAKPMARICAQIEPSPKELPQLLKALSLEHERVLEALVIELGE